MHPAATIQTIHWSNRGVQTVLSAAKSYASIFKRVNSRLPTIDLSHAELNPWGWEDAFSATISHNLPRATPRRHWPNRNACAAVQA